MGIVEILLLVILICWIGGLGFGIGGSAINLLLIVLIVLAILWFVRRGRTV